ncbi:hypothetical protein BS78_02G082800 [Paspalum vaginatum]|nr:hypothetical protein BS78_02G082800 [Paspalum vaginatum]
MQVGCGSAATMQPPPLLVASAPRRHPAAAAPLGLRDRNLHAPLPLTSPPVRPSPAALCQPVQPTRVLRLPAPRRHPPLPDPRAHSRGRVDAGASACGRRGRGPQRGCPSLPRRRSPVLRCHFAPASSAGLDLPPLPGDLRSPQRRRRPS